MKWQTEKDDKIIVITVESDSDSDLERPHISDSESENSDSEYQDPLDVKFVIPASKDKRQPKVVQSVYGKDELSEYITKQSQAEIEKQLEENAKAEFAPRTPKFFSIKF